ncbi:hypothetical protein [Streptomyces sp. NPDC002640]
MSLTVHAMVVDADGTWRIVDPPDDPYESAGFESWRTRVWGSQAVRSLGAVFFPVLAHEDLVVRPDELPAFHRECLLLREKLEEIVTGTEPVRSVEEHRWAIAERLRIIDEVVRRAQGMGGGIVIW